MKRIKILSLVKRRRTGGGKCSRTKAACRRQWTAHAGAKTTGTTQTHRNTGRANQEETPVSAVEPESPKTIYDYAFDAEAIRSELIALGQSMGLTHITDDDGIPCTPDTCSWASPVTASESFQGNSLKRALQNYVTSMPSTIASYGGTQITCFTIYVRDNGGGSYTFYFLY